MTKLGDNDGKLTIILVDNEDGASIDYVPWEEARDRLVTIMICAMFTGRATPLPSTQEPSA